jgi:uncharacterized protein HemY
MKVPPHQTEPEAAQKALEGRMMLQGARSAGVATALISLGWLYYQQGHLMKADSLLQEALIKTISVFRRVLPAGHDQIGELLHLTGDFYLRRNRPRAAQPLLREAVEMRRKRYGKDDARTKRTRALLKAMAAGFHSHD